MIPVSRAQRRYRPERKYGNKQTRREKRKSRPRCYSNLFFHGSLLYSLSLHISIYIYLYIYIHIYHRTNRLIACFLVHVFNLVFLEARFIKKEQACERIFNNCINKNAMFMFWSTSYISPIYFLEFYVFSRVQLILILSVTTIRSCSIEQKRNKEERKRQQEIDRKRLLMRNK